MHTYFINYEMCDEFETKEIEFEAKSDEHARIMYNNWKAGVEGFCSFCYLVNSHGEDLEV